MGQGFRAFATIRLLHELRLGRSRFGCVRVITRQGKVSPVATAFRGGHNQNGVGMDEDDYEDLLRWREGMEEREGDPLAESEQQEEDEIEKIVNDFLKSHPAER